VNAAESVVLQRRAVERFFDRLACERERLPGSGEPVAPVRARNRASRPEPEALAA
jgi:hypothetical protein